MADTQAPNGPLTFDIDIDALTFDDLAALEKPESATALRDVLNRCVVGGVGKVSVRHMKAIVEAILDAVKAASNPKGGEST